MAQVCRLAQAGAASPVHDFSSPGQRLIPAASGAEGPYPVGSQPCLHP